MSGKREGKRRDQGSLLAAAESGIKRKDRHSLPLWTSIALSEEDRSPSTDHSLHAGPIQALSTVALTLPQNPERGDEG